MKNNKKMIFVVGLAAVLILVTVGTVAWLTKTSSITNTFVIGDFNVPSTSPINPEETIKIDGNIYEPSFNQEEEHMIMPGVSFDKDPYVGIGKGSEDAAVYVYVENNFSNKVNFSINSGWEAVIATEGSISDTYTSGLFKYTAGLQSSSDSDVWTTTPLFSTLNVADDATGVDFTLDEEENPEIKVSAFLHQVSADGELISEDVIENAAKEAFGIN